MSAEAALLALDLAGIERLVGREEVSKGSRLADGGTLAHLARHEGQLFCEAKGSQGGTYRVSVALDEQGRIRARCSCRAAMFTAICKHATGLMIAWARTPEAFVRSEAGPAAPPSERASKPRGSTVRRGKTDGADLLRQGVDQASTLVRELAGSGVAGIGGDRIAQMRDLAEQLRSNRLRRLSARTLRLAELLSAQAEREERLDVVAYADLLTDIVLTVRRLEKHLQGEALEKRHEEELVGRSWRKNDREPIAGLDLLEVCYRTQTTADDFLIRESRFVDLRTGVHYSEKQIVPGFRAKIEPPKASRAGAVLRGASGGLFPGFPPRRIHLEADGLGRPERVGRREIEALLEVALPDLGRALDAYQEHRRDVFAPDGFPVLIATERLYVHGGRLRVADHSGATLPLAPGRGLQLALAELLAGRRLRAILGDLELDGVVPQLQPLAAVVEDDTGPSLHPLQAVPLRTVGPRRTWQEEARSAGLSETAVSLGEVRQELAMALMVGLRGLVPRVVEPLAARLRDLGIAKPIPLLEAAVAERDPAARLDPFVKVYVLLGMALVRLASAVRIRAEVVPIPTMPSVVVAVPERPLSPEQVTALAAAGAASRYEAELHYAAWYEAHPPLDVYPHWADGRARPHVVRAVAAQPDAAIRVACRVLETDPGRTARRTAYEVLDAVGTDRALERMVRISQRETDDALASWALAALDRRGESVALRRVHGRAGRGRRLAHGAEVELSAEITSASRYTERSDAIRRAVSCGAIGCLPALRAAFHGDASSEVQREAMIGLAMLGDAEVLDDLVGILERRGEGDDRDPSTAARAIGLLGDVRGVPALLRAFEAAFSPGPTADALTAMGVAAAGPLVALVARHPDLATRSALGSWMAKQHVSVVAGHVGAHLRGIAGAEAPAEVGRWLKLASAHKPALAHLVAASLDLADRLGGKPADQIRRKVARYPAAVASAPEHPEPPWWEGAFGEAAR